MCAMGIVSDFSSDNETPPVPIYIILPERERLVKAVLYRNPPG